MLNILLGRKNLPNMFLISIQFSLYRWRRQQPDSEPQTERRSDGDDLQKDIVAHQRCPRQRDLRRQGNLLVYNYFFKMIS